jgi:hypothetical protein
VKEFLGGARYRWTKLVSEDVTGSTGSQSLAIEDTGDCDSLPNGDVLESGVMMNPASGIVEPFEEIWRDEEVIDGTRVLVLVKRSQSEGEKGENLEGVWVLVGSVAQGVVRSDDGKVSACRWRCGGDGGSGWIVEAEYGVDTNELPVPTVALRTDYEGSSWIVREDYIYQRN